MGFDQDLEESKTSDILALDAFCRFYGGFYSPKSLDYSKPNKGYDAITYLPHKTEVKKDKMAEKTGNVYIETSCNGSPSGICSTMADFWLHKIPHLKTLLSFRPNDLFTYIEDNKDNLKSKSGGDGNRSNGVIIPIHKLKYLPFVTQIPDF